MAQEYNNQTSYQQGPPQNNLNQNPRVQFQQPTNSNFHQMNIINTDGWSDLEDKNYKIYSAKKKQVKESVFF